MSDDVAEQDQPRITAEPPESLPRRIATGPVLTEIGQYVSIEWDGANTSGIKPMGDTILILPDQPQARTAGGIYLSDNEIERRAYSAETGIIVAVGDGAWAWNADRTRKYEGERPPPGTRVFFERYAGQLPHGIDGLIYRMITDKQIGGIEIGLPDTHEFAMVDDKRVVRRKGQASQAVAQSAAGERLHKQAMAQMGAIGNLPQDRFPDVLADMAARTGIRLDEIEPEPPSAWPKYTKRNGAIIMAFNEDDARLKAPDSLWWPTSAEAEAAAAAEARLGV